MRIILLSGGSGKNLWPLSNGTRSKQFLRLLTAPDGGKESMLQRIVRQVEEAGLNVPITVATSQTQRDIVVNQLGNKVEVVTEPERRNTFPAIVLAASYLFFEKVCDPEESIVVMPCDSYTELSYYDCIKRMVKAIEANEAELMLMGIRPFDFSTDFGYIKTENSGGDFFRAVCFVEKPDIETAKRLVSEGAYWNAGVFAFKLKYILNMMKKYMDAKSFLQVRASYQNFPDISFDYEVVEKALSSAIVPYNGFWKDLGTWSALCSELATSHSGNVIFDDRVKGTHVINELDVPLFCSGVNNMVVAASLDGILIAGKDTCDDVKNHVDDFSVRPMYEERRWGTYKVIDQVDFRDGHHILTKQLNVKAGAHISYQLHHHREEIWTFVSGEGRLVLDGNMKFVRRGDVIRIEKGHLHAVMADKDLCIIEVQSGDLLTEEDIERFEWKWE